MLITISHRFLPKQSSTRASMVMDHFGIDFEQGEHTIARELELPIEPGQTVLFTGESGSGKSSLMRQVAGELIAGQFKVINLEKLDWEDRILVDLFDMPLEESLPLLAACGLGEAHLMLRTPGELSDGQRYRFKLALALSRKPDWILADEFTATLDRRLARMVAFNLKKLSQRTGVGFLLATTHEDIVPDLSADLHVRSSLDGRIEVNPADRQHESLKKKCPTSPATSGSLRRPSPTGRISLGGIIAATTSD